MDIGGPAGLTRPGRGDRVAEIDGKRRWGQVLHKDVHLSHDPKAYRRIDRTLHHCLSFTRHRPYMRLMPTMTRLAMTAPKRFRPSVVLFRAVFDRCHAEVPSSSEAVKIRSLYRDPEKPLPLDMDWGRKEMQTRKAVPENGHERAGEWRRTESGLHGYGQKRSNAGGGEVVMPAGRHPEEYDVIVVGSGVSGAAVARSVAEQGGRVLLLERGGRVTRMGSTLTVMRVLQGCGLTRSREQNPVMFADALGGASNLSAGCAMPPPASILAPLGIDLSMEADEVRRELGIAELPDRLIGEANFRLMDAAESVGLPWRKMEKFIDPEKCAEGCSDCMLGCRRGAKWTARAWVDEAVRLGADLKTNTRVDRVLCEGGSAAGVEAKRFGRTVQYRGKAVVLSAGISDVHLLRRVGIREAGKGFCCDWLQFVGGVVPGMSTHSAHPMAVGTTDLCESDGIIILPVFPSRPQFAVLLASKGLQHFSKLRQFRNYTGVMVKVQDETEGEIYPGGSFSKPITMQDRKRLDKGVVLIRKILKKVGAREDSILALNPIGTHPSAACRIGEVVDSDLETRILHLYCCDAGVLPRSLGVPLIWTLAALGKRLGTHLGRRLSFPAESRPVPLAEKRADSA